MSYFDIFPDTMMTFDEAIAEGMLIGSDSTVVEYVPFLSPFAHTNWENQNIKSSISRHRRFAISWVVASGFIAQLARIFLTLASLPPLN